MVGQSGWRQDIDDALGSTRRADALSWSAVISYTYAPNIIRGVLLAGDTAVHEIETTLRAAERFGDEMALVLLRMTLGIALIHHDSADHERGFDILRQLRETCVREKFALNVVPVFDIYMARRIAELGDADGAVAQLRAVADDMFSTGNMGNIDVLITALVETLLARGGEDDVAEAEAVIDRLATLPTNFIPAIREITVLRLQALLAEVRGDKATYRDNVDRYRRVATALGFEGHMKWAEAMA